MTDATGGVSICIPNWNHKTYLPRSVRSALEAAHALGRDGIACQILVLDDASRDGSQRLIASLALLDEDGYIDVYFAPGNLGLAGVRNQALQRARHRWVCFMDADNELVPENLAHFVRAAEHTQATLVYGNLISMSEGHPDGLISSDVIHEGVMVENYVDAFSLVNREQVLRLGGYTSQEYARSREDWDLLLHLIAEGCRLVFVPMVLGYYHIEPHSMLQTATFDDAKVYRVYNQRRTGLPLSFPGPLLYHPDLGPLL